MKGIRHGLPRSGRPLRRSSDDGAVLVEFAFVIGIFLLLVFGIVDFGLAVNAKTQITNASREAARLGTVNLDGATVEARARDVAVGLDPTRLTVAVRCELPDDSPCTGADPAGSLGNGSKGDSVVVEVGYRYDMLTPLPNFLSNGGIVQLSVVTEMRIE